jgi:hypothetical protein
MLILQVKEAGLFLLIWGRASHIIWYVTDGSSTAQISTSTGRLSRNLLTIFNTASSTAPQNPLYLWIEPRTVATIVHWESDTLITRLNLIRTRIDLVILGRLLIHRIIFIIISLNNALFTFLSPYRTVGVRLWKSSRAQLMAQLLWLQCHEYV